MDEQNPRGRGSNRASQEDGWRKSIPGFKKKRQQVLKPQGNKQQVWQAHKMGGPCSGNVVSEGQHREDMDRGTRARPCKVFGHHKCLTLSETERQQGI